MIVFRHLLEHSDYAAGCELAEPYGLISTINAGNLTHGSLPTAEPLAVVEHDDLISEVTGIYIHAC